LRPSRFSAPRLPRAPLIRAPSPSPIPLARKAVIEADHRCIGFGQLCRHRKSANRDYHRYGFHRGKKDKNGKYHLVKRKKH
jgi:hypothetical protein